jgi:hypothetical protein
MVTVLEKGRGFSVVVECTGSGNGGHGCGAKLGCNRDDMRYYPGVSWGSRDPAITIRCPECGSCTDLPRSKWPSFASDLRPYSKTWATTGRDPLDSSAR